MLAARPLGRRSPAAWGGGQALVLGAGLLKFYPLARLALLLDAPRRRMLVAGGPSLGMLALFGACFHAELSRIGANMATGCFGPMFGMRSLPFGLMLLLDAAGAPGTHLLGAWRRPLSVLLLAIAIAAGCVCALHRGRGRALRDGLLGMAPAERTLLLVGAVLCVGCFFAHQNIGYRAVLLILALPGSCALAGGRTGPAGWQHRCTAVAMVLVLWGGTLSRKPPVWLAVQLCWWWIVFTLLSIAVSLLGGALADRLGWRDRFEAGPRRRP